LFLTRKSAAAEDKNLTKSQTNDKKEQKDEKDEKRVHSAVWHFLFANTTGTGATTFVVAVVVVETTTTTRKKTYY